jgi:hypothetical protein
VKNRNELTTLTSIKIKEKKIALKKSKYFSVQFDFTLDRSHRVQLSFIIRIVEISDKAEVQINGYFITFIHIIYSTKLGLTEELKAQITIPEVDLSDCRGQVYDNGANIVCRHQGIQSTTLSENSRAFFPCSAHSLNVLFGENILSVLMIMSLFGPI